jgi:hypothetical protein
MKLITAINGDTNIAVGLLGHERSLDRAALSSQMVMAYRDAILLAFLNRDELPQLVMTA